MSTEKEVKGAEVYQEQHEDVLRRASTSEEITELSGIEATAASKAAWLISLTVSIGGFLFGTDIASPPPFITPKGITCD